MGGNVENNPNNKGLTPETARVLNDTYGITKRTELKHQIKAKLAEMLSNGQITEEQAKEAKKFLNSDNIIKALLGRNTAMDSNKKGTLLNDAANKLLADAGLTVEDLFNTVAKYIGEDWTLSYTHLSKSEKKDADEGKITSSELRNIQNELNKIIKENGGDYELTPKETKKLIDGLGIPIDKTINIPKVILTILTFGLAGTLTGVLTGGSEVTAKAVSIGKTPEGFVADTAVATASTSGAAAGAAAGAIGAFIAATIQVLRDIFRHEKSYGEQGGEAGGTGSVTNKTESKMYRMRTLAEGNHAIAEENSKTDQPQEPKRILPPNEKYTDADGVEHTVSYYYDSGDNILCKYDEGDNGVTKNTFYDDGNNLKAKSDIVQVKGGYNETIYDAEGNKKGYHTYISEPFEEHYYDDNNNEISEIKFDEIFNKLLE